VTEQAEHQIPLRPPWEDFQNTTTAGENRRLSGIEKHETVLQYSLNRNCWNSMLKNCDVKRIFGIAFDIDSHGRVSRLI
jgi:hypothetical protein